MLTALRNSLNGFMAYVIVGLVIVAFGVFGVPELGRMTQPSAVKAGGIKISAQEIDREFTQIIRRQESDTGTQISREDAIAQGFVDVAVKRLTVRTLLDKESDKFGLGVTDEMVREYLMEIPAFIDPITGRLDNNRMARALQDFGLSIQQFETVIRNELRRSQLTSALATPIPAPRPMAKDLLLRQSEARGLTVVAIPLDKLGDVPEPSEDDIKFYYDSNPDKFITPEYRKFRAVIFRPGDFAEGLEVSEEDLQTLWQLRKDSLGEMERRTVRILTFRSEESAKGALDQLKAGTTFAELAEHQNHAIENITFKDAMFTELPDFGVAQKAFALSEPGIAKESIKTPFGDAIFEVVDITPAEETSFEDERANLEQELLLEDTSRKMIETIEAVENLLDTGLPLEDALQEAAGVSMQAYGPVDHNFFTRGGAILDKLPLTVLNEAFALEEGDETPALPLDEDDGYFFMALDEVLPPARKSLDEVRGTIMTLWRADQISSKLGKAAIDVETRVAAGEDLKEVAQSLGYETKTVVVKRGEPNQSLPPSLMEGLFFADIGQSVNGQFITSNAIVIARIDDVFFPPLLQGEETMLTLYQNAMGAQIADETFQAYLNTMEAEEGVKINEAVISTVFGTDLAQ
jgi:peptidyl-prolyl cis-trans isomerase D